ncbi:MAG TPA: CoA transferase, partial [Reyranella sp.]
MPGVLEGIRVLDFGRYIAGPFCGTMLGDLGAEVIRIEKLDGSEDRWVTPVAQGGEGAIFLQMGRNKLGLTLNPMKPAGREIVKKLLAVSDVVIANLPYETLQDMGIDYETISAINPRIILATTSTFGSEGPYATRVGFDTIGQAMSGAMFLSGDGKVPTRMNAPYVDFGTALLNTVGVLAALMDRAKSGKGQKVETALLRTAINITNGHLIEQAMLNLNRIATLNRGFTAGPSDTFKCSDGWIYAMTIGQPLFARWCKLM